MKLTRVFLKNPLSLWIMWLYNRYYFILKNKNKNLDFRYLASATHDCSFGKYNVIYEGAKLSTVSLGDYSYVGPGCKINKAIIGKFCCLGPETIVGAGMHPSRNFVSLHPAFYSTLKQCGVTFSDSQYFNEFSTTVIGNDVWIGARSIVLDGISIGDGAIVAAGSVVTKNVAPFTIVGGVPAKFIRYRFLADEIELIQKSSWWNRDFDWFKDNFHLFHNIDLFKYSI